MQNQRIPVSVFLALSVIALFIRSFLFYYTFTQIILNVLSVDIPIVYMYHDAKIIYQRCVACFISLAYEIV